MTQPNSAPSPTRPSDSREISKNGFAIPRNLTLKTLPYVPAIPKNL